MKFNLKKIASAVVAVAAISAPLLALGQFPTPPQTLQTPITDITGVQSLLCTILGWVFTFFLIIAILFIILAGWKYLTAGGDPEKVKAANHQLIYAVVAIVVAVLAKGIPLIINAFVGGSGNIVSC